MSGHTPWSEIVRTTRVIAYAAEQQPEPDKEVREQEVDPQTNATMTKLTPDSGSAAGDNVAQPAPVPGELYTGNEQ